jgi:hypothetical protein
MTNAQELMNHPPHMAEMAGGVLEAESHITSPVHAGHPEEVPLGLAQLEAETEE